MQPYNFTTHDIDTAQAQRLTEATDKIYTAIQSELNQLAYECPSVEVIITSTNNLLEGFIRNMEKRNRNQKYLSVVGAGLLVHIREHDIPLTASEIATILQSATGNDGVTKSRIVTWKHDIEVYRGDLTPPIDPKHWIDRYSNELELDDDTKQVAIQLAKVADMNGRSPNVAAARFIWLATEQTDTHIDKPDVVETADTTRQSMQKGAETIREKAYPLN